MLLETTGLEIAKYVVIVFQVLVCLLLILVVMMQRPKQEGLGAAFGGDTMDSLTGAHATDFLQKGTAFLGTLLFVLTFVLSILVISGASDANRSLANESEKAPETPTDSKEAAALKGTNPDEESDDKETEEKDEASTSDEGENSEKEDDSKSPVEGEQDTTSEGDTEKDTESTVDPAPKAKETKETTEPKTDTPMPATDKPAVE